MAVLNAEMLRSRRKFYDFRCDIWSLGHLLQKTAWHPWFISFIILSNSPVASRKAQKHTETPSKTSQRSQRARGVIIYCLLKGGLPYSLEELVAYVEDQAELPGWTGAPSDDASPRNHGGCRGFPHWDHRMGVLHIRWMGLFRSNREEYGEELLYFHIYSV